MSSYNNNFQKNDMLLIWQIMWDTNVAYFSEHHLVKLGKDKLKK